MEIEELTQTVRRFTRHISINRTHRGMVRVLNLIVILGVSLLWPRDAAVNAPPKAPKDNVKETIHGVEVVDPYRWLENRSNPETEAWIKAQDDYTRSILGALPGRESLKQRLTELLRVDTSSTPVERNGRYFYTKRLADQELPVLYVREGLKGPEEILIDPHPMSPDRSVSVSLMEASQDGKVLAYGVRQGGEDETTIKLFDVDARKDLPDRLPKGRYFEVSFMPDRSGFYYSREEANGPRVYDHALGKDSAQDVEIFGKGYGRDKIAIASVSEDGRYLVIHVFHGAAADRSEVYFQDLVRHGPTVPIVNDLAARFIGEVGGDQLFIETNWKAPNGRVFAVDLNHPAREQWREIIPESDAVIDDFSLAGGKVFVTYLKNVRSSLKIFEPDGRPSREVPLPSLGSISGVRGRWKGDHAFFAFTSFHTPVTIYHYAVSQGTQEVWARPTVPIQDDKFELSQVWFESKDKTKVPMFLLHAKAVKLDGSNPTLLTGYGGFDVSETPVFSPRAVLWVERGGVFALPNLRGGGEFGEEWHRAGMREKKQNVFDDFFSAAEWLIQKGYTNPSRLAISGRSNGGLLVGAALTQRPDLFQAVVCGYPLLDMVRYQKFLVAQYWVSEYGSSDDAQQFKCLYAYSPYQHVMPGGKYPAVLFVTGDGDTRVDPLHARKMCALLQAATGSDRPVLLHYDTKAGHTAAEPVSKLIADLADEMSFLFWQLHVPLAGEI